jgi:transcriptional regulator with XRE-family HTH domain
MDSKVIRARRAYLGLSQAALAEAIGRSQTWLSKVELGKLLPQREQQEKLALVLKEVPPWK